MKQTRKTPNETMAALPNPPADTGLSLDQLSQAWQLLLNHGDDPYSVPTDDVADPLLAAANAPLASEQHAALKPTEVEDDQCEISPRTILEAMLFVGLPDNQPLNSERIAGMMRGVTAAEIDEHVRDLNATYAAANCPYYIESLAAGYRFSLRSEYDRFREALYGRIRPARLSPAAVDVLAIAAYQQPITAEQIERQRGTASTAILSQLVRRELLAITRDPARPRVPLYSTTDRFLRLFGLESLEDLPKGLELER